MNREIREIAAATLTTILGALLCIIIVLCGFSILANLIIGNLFYAFIELCIAAFSVNVFPYCSRFSRRLFNVK